jgi:hypothetical protein
MYRLAKGDIARIAAHADLRERISFPQTNGASGSFRDPLKLIVQMA